MTAALGLILLTAFEPFGGKLENRSIDIAYQTCESIRQKSDFECKVCLLPVIYDLAADSAYHCMEQLGLKSLAAVLSLGEGGCELKIETQMKNWDGVPDFADNAGKVRPGSKISSSGPEVLETTLLLQEEWNREIFQTKWESLRQHVLVSESAGAFVCNNTGYRLLEKFYASPALRNVPYGFVHVPVSGCGVDPLAQSELISDLVLKSIKATHCLASR